MERMCRFSPVQIFTYLDNPNLEDLPAFMMAVSECDIALLYSAPSRPYCEVLHRRSARTSPLRHLHLRDALALSRKPTPDCALSAHVPGCQSFRRVIRCCSLRVSCS